MDALPQAPAPEAKLKGGGPLVWPLDGYARDDMLLTAGAVGLPRSSDFLQNCDLPPPLKVFAATTPGALLGGSAAPSLPIPVRKTDRDLPGGADRGDPGRLAEDAQDQDHLLRAMRLSQTRAREAEEKAASMAEKNRRLISLFIEDSLRLNAHRRLLRLLEIENLWMRKERSKRRKEAAGGGCAVVVAICLGIAGLGFLIGCRFVV